MQQQEITTLETTSEQPQLFQNQQAVPQNFQPSLQEQPVLYQNQQGISSQKFQPIFQKSQQECSPTKKTETTNFRMPVLGGSTSLIFN